MAQLSNGGMGMGDMASAVARLYNGGLGSEPQRGVRGQNS